ncbi:MADS-box protein AeAP3-2-like isoform X3 [Nymphaea colorata]|uniref:MADS-box protein AeAP3-2-like isoform X3 n=1 Tax=Nymphaea colorata TaxID=210225 RepID=UPI00129DB4AA|nr:MADS-box protein AeAP3-2-like isoform X3 [Nymphaea colorata]
MSSPSSAMPRSDSSSSPAVGRCSSTAVPTPACARLLIDSRKHQALEFRNTMINRLPDHCQQIYCEMTKMKNENDKLQATMRHLTGEDLTTLTMNDLHHLEQQLEVSVDRVRARKNQLINQQLDNLRRKERLLEEHNNELSRALIERQVAMEPKVIDAPALLDHFGTFYQDEQSRDLLQLSPPFSYRLQPTQPNLQDPNLHHHGLQL